MKLQKKIDQIRKDVIKTAIKNNRGHIASALSKIEVLVYLFYKQLKKEDRFILSSGHSCYGLYSILADKKIIPKNVWKNFELDGCLTRMPEYGILASTGSLGQGLSIACGIAFAKKIKKEKGYVYCLVGDGEMEEGQIWEALLFAESNKLNNLCIIIDCNGLRALDKCLLPYQKLRNRLNGFDFEIIACCGHDIKDIEFTFNYILKEHRGFPKLILSRSVKGKGLKCAENKAHFHYRTPSQKEMNLNNE